MIALCVDDEYLLLNSLKRTIKAADETIETVCFTNELEAIEWAKTHPFDLAFLDIQLHVMTGLELAQKIKEINDGVPCIFCTAYEQYAVDAIDQELTDGYLLKPVRPQAVADRIACLKKKNKISDKLLTVKKGKAIEILDKHGKVIQYSRKMPKQLFLLLLEQEGRSLDTAELCEMLFGDDVELFESNRRYLWTIISYLRHILASVGAEDVLVKENKNSYRIDMSLVRIIEE